ncbi:MAG TPA: Gfo/Idh/MocA family oxidoreductase [Phycisphaerae bacterium]|nr:Gfo/Idh/MocA family oxidoreductase [Phycisphaerae bacterium]
MAKRICVVGAGRWGRNHVKTLHDFGHLGAVVDCDRKALATLGQGYPGIPTFGEVADALAAGFDAFTVATPAETHFDIARQILTAGKPVLVEKPLALTSAEAKALKALADKKGVPLMVGHVLLFHPAIRRIKELLAAGKIGRLQYLYSNRLNFGIIRQQENILWSFAPHDISIFQYLIGARPIDIGTHGAMFLDRPLHDSTLTVLKYPGGVTGHIFVSWLHPFKEHRLVIIGDKGMLTFVDSASGGGLHYYGYPADIDWMAGAPVKPKGPPESIAYDATPPLTAEMAYFVERLDKGPPEIADAASAIEVLEILEQATQSLVETDRRGQHVGKDYFVHASSYVDDGAEIGAGTKIWHFSHVQTGARIGKNCSIGQNVNIAPNVRIGDHVKIQNNVSVYEGVELEDHVFCGPSMVFTNITDPRSKYPQRGAEHYHKTLVRQGATIGANATILCGHTLGRHCFIGAGAVVTGDVPDYALMLGVPAKQAGWVCECGERLPEITTNAACSRCKRQYVLANGVLSCGTG